jgi:hypothetical protein
MHKNKEEEKKKKEEMKKKETRKENHACVEASHQVHVSSIVLRIGLCPFSEPVQRLWVCHTSVRVDFHARQDLLDGDFNPRRKGQRG